MRFKKGDIAYLVENHRWIRQVEIVSVSGGFYAVQFCDTKSAAIRVRDSRLFKTEEDASKTLNVIGHKNIKKKKSIQCRYISEISLKKGELIIWEEELHSYQIW